MDLHVRLSETRRQLHAVAETGFALTQTRTLLSQLLTQAGLESVESAGGLVVDTGEGKNSILLRADMDALPLKDGKEVSYKSLSEEACHSCGHDAHMAMLYGGALLLQEEKLDARLRYMFQPAEECPPGGALGMIENGVLSGIDMAFAMHVAPWLPFGTIGIKEGVVMAAADNFSITIHGRGGHGAMPHECVDAVVVAAQVVVGLQTLASRMADPLEPLVVTVGKINGGTAANVIADEVVLEGTVRTLNKELRKELPGWIEQTAQGICAGFKASCQTEYKPGYPVLHNWSSGVDVVLEAAEKVVGSKVVKMENPLMGGEDFAYVLEQVPGAFLFLGTGDARYSHPLHHPCFDFNEEILSVGAQLFRELTKAALRRL